MATVFKIHLPRSLDQLPSIQKNTLLNNITVVQNERHTNNYLSINPYTTITPVNLEEFTDILLEALNRTPNIMQIEYFT